MLKLIYEVKILLIYLLLFMYEVFCFVLQELKNLDHYDLCYTNHDTNDIRSSILIISIIILIIS